MTTVERTHDATYTYHSPPRRLLEVDGDKLIVINRIVVGHEWFNCAVEGLRVWYPVDMGAVMGEVVRIWPGEFRTVNGKDVCRMLISKFVPEKVAHDGDWSFYHTIVGTQITLLWPIKEELSEYRAEFRLKRDHCPDMLILDIEDSARFCTACLGQSIETILQLAQQYSQNG